MQTWILNKYQKKSVSSAQSMLEIKKVPHFLENIYLGTQNGDKGKRNRPSFELKN